MTLQQKLAQADDYLDMLKDKAKETDELAKENLQLRKEIERLNNIKNDYEQRINDVLLYIECCDVFYDTKKIARILNGKEKLKKKYLTRR